MLRKGIKLRMRIKNLIDKMMGMKLSMGTGETMMY